MDDGPYHAMKGAVIGRFRFHAAMERAKKGEFIFQKEAKPHSHYLSRSLAHSRDLLGKRKRGKKADIKRSLPSRMDGRDGRRGGKFLGSFNSGPPPFPFALSVFGRFLGFGAEC